MAGAWPRNRVPGLTCATCHDPTREALLIGRGSFAATSARRVRIFVSASCQAAVCYGVAICRLTLCPLTDEPLRPLSALGEVH